MFWPVPLEIAGGFLFGRPWLGYSMIGLTRERCWPFFGALAGTDLPQPLDRYREVTDVS